MAEVGQYSPAGYADHQAGRAALHTAGPGHPAGGPSAQRIAAERLTELSEFWRAELEGCPPELDLRAGRRNLQPELEDETWVFDIGPDLTAALRAWAEGATCPVMIPLLTLFQALISCYAGAAEFLVAVPVPVPEVSGADEERSSGLASSMVPVRSVISRRRSFNYQITETKKTVDRAFAHAGLPYHFLAERLEWPADPSGPLRPQVMFTFISLEEAQSRSVAGQPGLRQDAGRLAVAREAASGELSMVVIEAGRQMHGMVRCAPRLFDQRMLRQFATHYIALAEQACAEPDIALAQAELLSAGERKIIDAMNQTRTDYPRLSSLGELFAEQVASRAEAPAVTYGPITLTYRQLDTVTDSLAARLRDLGVGPGALVAIHADRDISVVVGMLATIKAGGAYLPLEPTHPAMRLRKIVAEAQPVVLLARSATDDPLELGLPVVAVAPYLCAETREPSRPDVLQGCGARADDLAYVMYTSGSTGQPKGTCITHRNVVRLVRNTDYAQFRPGNRVAQISNAAFDAATFEVWGALLNGGHLVGIERDAILSPSQLATALEESGIDTMVMATPLFNQLAADNPAIFANLSQLLVGGDVMGVGQARSVAEIPGCTLVNGYGPTECTTFATAHRVVAVPADQVRIPIGRPIANTTCYVLDDVLQLQPSGVAGQLYIGGDGISWGYLGQPGLTADRFVPDPFAAEPGARMYATGDLVRLLPDGSLDFLGRADSQAKVRGFRIELGEIDAALLEHPAIVETVTILSDNQYGDKALVSYYVPARGQAPGRSEVVQFLRERLPEYMVPGHLIELPEMPKNANMKIDRPKLPAPPAAGLQGTHGSPVSAANLLDDEIATIVGQLLDVPRFGLAENFFESGGHSLLATRLLAEVRQRFRVNMPLSELFDDPTPRGIAAYVRQHAESPPPRQSPDAHD